jgi:hypothetical protein
MYESVLCWPISKECIQHAIREKEDAIYYPCKVCSNNVMYVYNDCEIICKHLVRSGFMDNYFIWSKHGETQPRSESIIDEREEENINGFMDNYFIWSKHGETQPRTESIIDEREEENMNADHVYSIMVMDVIRML